MTAPEEFPRQLHARLDAIDVPDTPWERIRSRAAAKRRRTRGRLLMTIPAGLAAVAAAITALALTLPGRGATSSVAGHSPAAATSAQAAAHTPGPAGPPGHRVTAAMAARPGFLIFVTGRTLTGPVLSSTSIGAGNAGWSSARNSVAVVAASRSGQAYYTPSVNPRHTKVVYVEGPAAQIGAFAGQGNLATARIDGSGARTVTTSNTDSSPVWSPDGRQIAFLRDGAIWLMSSTGARQHPLGIGLNAHTISWSPDGKELAVGSGDGPVRIAIINIARRSFRWFTPAGHLEQYDPAWSPDGKQLVYGQTGPNALFISNLNGTGTRQLTTCSMPRCTEDVGPVWSPDGAQIAFISSYGGVDQIAVVRSSGGKVRLLTAGPYEHSFPSW